MSIAIQYSVPCPLTEAHDSSFPVTIGNEAPIDLSGHEPDPEFDTVLRILEVCLSRSRDVSTDLRKIDNALVRKQLIISNTIEQTILIEERKDAMERMFSTKLRNVKQCFALGGGGEGYRFHYGYGGEVAQTFMPKFEGSPRMKTDVEYQIKYVPRRVGRHLLIDVGINKRTSRI